MSGNRGQIFYTRDDRVEREPVTYRTPLPVTSAFGSLLGEELVAERTPIIELNSAYGVSLIRDVVTEVNSGAVTSSPGEIKLNTGATANSVAGIRSAENGRYVPGYAAEVGIGIRIVDSPVGNQSVTWGARSIDGNNGFIFGLDSGGFYVARIRAGTVLDKTYQADFNIDSLNDTGPTGQDLDLTEGNIFQIDFTWYGYGQIQWSLVAPDSSGRQRPIPFHRLDVNGSPSTNDPNFEVFAEAENGATESDFELYVGGRQYSIVGKYLPAFRFVGAYRSAVATSTTARPLVTFRKKTAFRDRACLMDLVQVLPATEPVIVEMRLNGTLTGASFGTPVNYTASELAEEVDVSATAITGGIVLWSEFFQEGAANKEVLSTANVNLVIPEDQPISLCVRSATEGTGTCAAFFRMREEW